MDFLIVGQGIAGTMLAHFLLKKNQTVCLIDKSLTGASTRIAAGVINPITGRRMVKSWRFEELFSFAKKTYQSLEKELEISIWQERNILRTLPTVFDENEWLRRSAFPENKSYFREQTDLGAYLGKVRTTHSWGELRGSVKVDLAELVNTYRKYFVENEALSQGMFDHKNLSFQKKTFDYKGKNYKKIVFCEGSKARFNPYFKYLPFALTKGELLLVKIPGAGFQKMLKGRIYIVPMKEDLYWVGSTNHFEFDTLMPTAPDRLFLENELKRILKIPFLVVKHLAGIRPTVKDKRPLLGLHPEHPQLAIFNGLGTKGASLAPYFAEQMAGYLLGENTLDQEIDIRRFEK